MARPARKPETVPMPSRAKLTPILSAGLLLGALVLVLSSSLETETGWSGVEVTAEVPEARSEPPPLRIPVPEVVERLDAGPVPPPPIAEREPAPFAFRIEVQVFDELDLPVAGAEVYLAPIRRPLNYVGKTGTDGRLVVRFRGRCERIEMALLVDSPDMERVRALEVDPGRDFLLRGGVLSGLRRLEVRADEVAHLALVARSDDVLGLWIDHPRARLASRPSGDGTTRRDVASWRAARDRSLHQLALPPSTRGEIVTLTAPLAELDEEGWTSFVAPAGISGPELLERVRELEERGEFDAAERLELTQRRSGPERGAEWVRRRRARSEKRVGSPPAKQPAAPRRSELPETTVQVTVTRPDGAPAVLAPVTVRSLAGWREPLLTDSSGVCLLRRVPPGAVRLRAGGGDFGVAEQELRLVPGVENVWTAMLDRGIELRARLLDENGRPRGYWQVELERIREALPHVDTAITDAEGGFTVPNLPPGLHRLLLRPPGPWGTFPLAVIDGVLPSCTELELRVPVDPSYPQTALLEVAHPTGKNRADVEARIWNEELGRGAWMTATGPYASLESIPLLFGAHEYSYGTSGRGWSLPRWFGASIFHRLGLGVQRLDEPGVLQLEGQEPEQAVQYAGLRLVEVGSGVDVLVIDELQAVELPLRLPAGEYRIDRTDGSSREFVLGPGETVELEPVEGREGAGG